MFHLYCIDLNFLEELFYLRAGWISHTVHTFVSPVLPQIYLDENQMQPSSLGGRVRVGRSDSRNSMGPPARKPKMGPKWHLRQCLYTSIFRQGGRCRPRPPPSLTRSRGRALNTRHRNCWHSGGGARRRRNCCGSDNHRELGTAYCIHKA